MHRIAVALKWACGATTLALVVMFLTPLAIGGPGAHQAPLLAFLLSPIIFIVTLTLAFVWSPLGLVAVVVSVLYPAWYYIQSPPREPQPRVLRPVRVDSCCRSPDAQAEEHRLTHSGCYKSAPAGAAPAELAARAARPVIKM